jgi:predicted HTH domain antitoxin
MHWQESVAIIESRYKKPCEAKAVHLIMRTLLVRIPDTVDIEDKEALMAIASKLYEKGRLSLGQAAELAGLSKEGFMEVLNSYGTSLFNYPVTDIERDSSNAKSYNS